MLILRLISLSCLIAFVTIAVLLWILWLRQGQHRAHRYEDGMYP